MLDRFPSLLAASTFVVLSLSVTHELGYYSQFDQHIQALVSPADYFSSALLWLPYIAVTYFVFAALTMLQLRLDDFKFLGGKKRGLSYHMLGASVVALAIAGFFVTPSPGVWYSYGTAASYVWAILFSYIVTHENVASRMSFATVIVGIFLPILLFFAYSTGLVEGKRDLSRNDPTYTLISKGKEEQSHSVVLLRALDKGLLVRDRADIQFFGWPDISTFRMTPSPSDRTHACLVLGILCNWPRPAT
jgi:hypothetical protein